MSNTCGRSSKNEITRAHGLAEKLYKTLALMVYRLPRAYFLFLLLLSRFSFPFIFIKIKKYYAPYTHFVSCIQTFTRIRHPNIHTKFE
jgi:hypothetical protein